MSGTRKSNDKFSVMIQLHTNNIHKRRLREVNTAEPNPTDTQI